MNSKRTPNLSKGLEIAESFTRCQVCDASLAAFRKGTKYCGPECKREAFRARHKVKASEAFWGAYRGVRRRRRAGC